jgi:glycosyltransferase involved in cell wall biosynthesis
MHVAQLATGLRERGWDVQVAGPASARVYGHLRASSFVVHHLPFRRGFREPWRDAATVIDLHRLIRRAKIDVVHCHSSKAGLVGRLAAALAGVPRVYTPHCYAFMVPGRHARRALLVAIERVLSRLTHATVCVSEDERAAAIELHVAAPAQLHRVWNACETESGDGPTDPNLALLRGSGPVAGTVGVLRSQKGLDVFLEAATRIIDRVPRAQLAIVGDGPLAPALRQRANSLGLLGRLHFLPFGSSTGEHLRGLDVFVLPSRWEGMPIAILEALAVGVPQAASDVGGVREAVDPTTGILVAPGDSAALADAVAALLSDPTGARRAPERPASVMPETSRCLA